MTRLLALCALSLALSTLGCGLERPYVPTADAGTSSEDGGVAQDAFSALCPSDVDPFGTPGTACSVEGARCTNGGTDVCGSFMQCDCAGGRWRCLVAEPDPVCWCGRQPSVGDRCSSEGASCGECCPTLGGTGWPAMTCVSGHWAPAPCPEIVCPPLPMACPVSGAAAQGTSCAAEGQICGNPCCGTGFMCTAGVWGPGPDVDCFDCDPSGTFACGEGTCERGQACTAECGPTDGIVHSCALLEPGCNACACATTPPGASCVERDGHVFFETMLLCG